MVEVVVSVTLLLVGITVLVWIHVCMMERGLRREDEDSNGNGGGESGGKRMCCEELNKLPCFEYKFTAESVVNKDCAVCLDNFKVGDACRLLHVHCLDSWLLKTAICPICRTRLLSLESAFSENAVIEMA